VLFFDATYWQNGFREDSEACSQSGSSEEALAGARDLALGGPPGRCRAALAAVSDCSGRLTLSWFQNNTVGIQKSMPLGSSAPEASPAAADGRMAFDTCGFAEKSLGCARFQHLLRLLIQQVLPDYL